MSDAQLHQIEQSLPAIGQAIGGPIGGAVASVISDVAGLFGGKVHTTPSGATYKEATATLADQETVINSLYQRVFGKPLDSTVPPVGDTAAWWSYQTGLVARYLNNPALQSGDPKNYDKLKANGSIDQADAIQKTYIAQLQAMLDSGQVATNGSNSALGVTSAVAALGGANGPLFLVLIFGAFFFFRK